MLQGLNEKNVEYVLKKYKVTSSKSKFEEKYQDASFSEELYFHHVIYSGSEVSFVCLIQFFKLKLMFKKSISNAQAREIES